MEGLEGIDNTFLIVVSILFNILFFGFLTWIFLYRAAKSNLREIGFKPVVFKWKWLAGAFGITLLSMILSIGIIIGLNYLIYGDIEGVKTFRDTLFEPQTYSVAEFTVWLIFIGILGPIIEELFCRGGLMTWFKKFMPSWLALLLPAVIFGLLHLDSWPLIISTTVMGIILGISYNKTGTIWMPIAIHCINNSIAVILLFLRVNV